jgi:hypothetical protein
MAYGPDLYIEPSRIYSRYMVWISPCRLEDVEQLNFYISTSALHLGLSEHDVAFDMDSMEDIHD